MIWKRKIKTEERKFKRERNNLDYREKEGENEEKIKTKEEWFGRGLGTGNDSEREKRNDSEEEMIQKEKLANKSNPSPANIAAVPPIRRIHPQKEEITALQLCLLHSWSNRSCYSSQARPPSCPRPHSHQLCRHSVSGRGILPHFRSGLPAASQLRPPSLYTNTPRQQHLLYIAASWTPPGFAWTRVPPQSDQSPSVSGLGSTPVSSSRPMSLPGAGQCFT